MNIRTLIPWQSREKRDLPTGWEERSPVDLLHREMDRLFDEFFTDLDEPFNWPISWSGTKRDSQAVFSPRVNVTESTNALEISAELPGLELEDLDISLDNHLLTIKGEKKAEHEAQEKNYYRLERSYGSFSRTIALPENGIDQDKVEADFKNGVLTIKLPKLTDYQSTVKQIPVKSG
jgi:HSP20 family protein